MLWQHRDIEDMELARIAIKVDAAHRSSIHANHVMAGPRIFRRVMALLCGKLHAHECILLLGSPRNALHFLRPRTRINGKQKFFVRFRHRTQCDVFDHQLLIFSKSQTLTFSFHRYSAFQRFLLFVVAVWFWFCFCWLILLLTLLITNYFFLILLKTAS